MDKPTGIVERQVFGSGKHAVHGAPGPAAFVSPLARAITVLAVFSPLERWLATQEIAHRTGLPLTTTVRLLKSLRQLGYLYVDEESRRYRLTAKVLTLGYAAIAHSEIQRLAVPLMSEFADSTDTHVVLGSRDRLSVVILENCMATRGRRAVTRLNPGVSVGKRVPIAASPLGWALLAALPELERSFLVSNLERRTSRDWPGTSYRISRAVAQVRETGYCTSLGEWDPEIAVVAVPLSIYGSPPMALACVGPSAQMTKARIERDLGRRVIALARHIAGKAKIEECRSENLD